MGGRTSYTVRNTECRAKGFGLGSNAPRGFNLFPGAPIPASPVVDHSLLLITPGGSASPGNNSYRASWHVKATVPNPYPAAHRAHRGRSVLRHNGGGSLRKKASRWSSMRRPASYVRLDRSTAVGKARCRYTMIQLGPVGFALSTDLYYEDIARLNCRARFRAHGRGPW
jgi:hypothetical protein